MASKITLQQLKRKPQFIDAVFAAKGDRTKMEEEPVLNVPDTEVKQDFIIPQKQDEPKADSQQAASATPSTSKKTGNDTEVDEFDLSDIKATPKQVSAEDIIAASMAEAYKE